MLSSPISKATLAFGALGICLASTQTAAAAEAYSGPKDVTVDGHETMKESSDEVVDTTEASVQAGLLVSGGNSRSTAGSAMGNFMLRRSQHEFSAVAAVNYARSASEDDAGNDTGMETTMENYQGRLRYDYFWTRNFSNFLAVQARRDKFQGLNLRLGIDPGVSYFFVRHETLRLWSELGYDFQYDVITDDTLQAAIDEGSPIDRTATDHNIRGFLGYDQKIDDRLSLNSGLEIFKSVVHAKSYRINWNAALNMQLFKSFSLAINSTAMYNNTPLPDVRKFDVTTSLNFVYTIL